jgi:hypothetical protein
MAEDASERTGRVVIGSDFLHRKRFIICSRCARIGPRVAHRRGRGGARYAAVRAGWRTAERKGAGTGGGIDLCPSCVKQQELMEMAERDMAGWVAEHGEAPDGFVWSGDWQFDKELGRLTFRGAMLSHPPGYPVPPFRSEKP